MNCATDVGERLNSIIDYFISAEIMYVIFNLTHFQSHIIQISHTSNLTLFQSHTLPISHSSNLAFFQSHTLSISHSFRFTLFQSYTQLRIWEEKNCELFPTYFTSLTRHAIQIEVLLLPVIAPVFFLLASNAGQAS